MFGNWCQSQDPFEPQIHVTPHVRRCLFLWGNSWAGCSVARHVGRWGAEGCNSRTTLFGHHSSTSKAPTIKMLTTVISVVMMGRLMATATPPPATVGEKLQFLVQSAGLVGARRGGLGWPWASASIPPDSFYDCLYLYFSCTDHHPPGGPWAWSRIHESLVCTMVSQSFKDQNSIW